MTVTINSGGGGGGGGDDGNHEDDNNYDGEICIWLVAYDAVGQL